MVERSARRDSSPSDLESIVVEQHYLVASWRNVCIAVWIDETPPHALEEVRAMVARLALAWPSGIALLQVIGEENQSLEGPVRAGLKSLLMSGRGAIREAPVVYEGSGFRAAAVRAIVTGLLAQRSYGFPNRVYSNVEDAARVIARLFEKREPTLFARQLCEALAALRDQHQRAFPTAPHSFIRYRG